MKRMKSTCALSSARSEIVRITVDRDEAAAAVPPVDLGGAYVLDETGVLEGDLPRVEGQLSLEQFIERPQAEALVCGPRRTRFAALVDRVARLAAVLQARGVQPDVLISGSMQRHQETAAGALAELGLPPESPLIEHAGVNEFDHENVIEVAEPRYARKAVMMADMAAGGDPRRAFQKFFQDAVSRWVGGNHDDEYAEPWSVFKLRCVTALDDLVQATPPKGQSVVFTSGGTISVMCAHLLGLSDAQAFTINWTLANTGITKVNVGRDGLHLLSVNEHGHLEGHASSSPSLLSYR
mgnify:CR=1 FL=1